MGVKEQLQYKNGDPYEQSIDATSPTTRDKGSFTKELGLDLDLGDRWVGTDISAGTEAGIDTLECGHQA